jgi:hypothetical protein
MGIWTLGAAVIGVALWAPPSVEEVTRLAQEYQAAATPQRWNPERDGSPQEYLARIAAETLAKVGDPSEFELEHFGPLLETNLFLYAADSSAYLERLLVLAEDETVSGARAALNSFTLAGHASKERQAEALDAALAHPAIGEALREPDAWSHLTSVWYMFPADLGRERAERIVEVLGEASVPEAPTLWDVMGGVRLFDWLRSGDPDEMTWPVVFIPGSVFNPSYGVKGIPHIAVVGADGLVLGNDVGMEELAGMIDGALSR